LPIPDVKELNITLKGICFNYSTSLLKPNPTDHPRAGRTDSEHFNVGLELQRLGRRIGKIIDSEDGDSRIVL
jgi:hypothetical protein